MKVDKHYRVIRYVVMNDTWYHVEEQHSFLFFKWWMTVCIYRNLQDAIDKANELRTPNGTEVYFV